MQKLLYYVQGYNLAVFGKPLFNDSIEAWQYGPVVKTAYHHFKDFGSSAITLTEDDQIAELEDEEEGLFQEVLDEYSQFSAIRLMEMTHDEAPWNDAFHTNPQVEISQDSMKEFFKTQLA
ncbi:Panacea domain-containing protein [Gangjinia marincola]|uniref:Panacea domain-containing protein n=1 Tax=Gangjinia marincola TaxID=578463 RepID=UPI0031DE9835